MSRSPHPLRNVFMLAAAQMLGSSGLTVVVILGGIVAAQMAPRPSLATVPISLAIVATALTTIPASLLMRRIGRRAGFIVGAFDRARRRPGRRAGRDPLRLPDVLRGHAAHGQQHGLHAAVSIRRGGKRPARAPQPGGLVCAGRQPRRGHRESAARIGGALADTRNAVRGIVRRRQPSVRGDDRRAVAPARTSLRRCRVHRSRATRRARRSRRRSSAWPCSPARVRTP